MRADSSKSACDSDTNAVVARHDADAGRAHCLAVDLDSSQREGIECFSRGRLLLLLQHRTRRTG